MINFSHILVIDTATPQALVGLWANGHITEQVADVRRADNLLVLTDKLLRHHQIGLHDVGGIIVRRGRGSYTGLRVGVTIANTLSWSLKIPLVGVTSKQERHLTATELIARGTKRLLRTHQKENWPDLVPIYRPWHD